MMHHFSFLIYLIITSLIALISWVYLTKSIFFKKILAQQKSNRILTLDGLRGLLIFGILLHHSTITYFYYIKGIWEVPPSIFYTNLGQTAVVLFFMISGFTIWRQIINGRKIVALKFYISRIKKIVPLYIFSTICLFLIIAIVTRFKLNVSILDLFEQIGRWFTFAFLGQPNINGFKETLTIQGVYWFLKWEWIFYIFIPLAAWLRHQPVLLILATSIYCFYWQEIFPIYFVLGGLAAYLLYQEKLKKYFNSIIFGGLSILSIISVFILFKTSYGYPQSILIFIFFLSVVNQNKLFNFLKLAIFRFQGLISYSIFLIHNLVIFIIFRLVNIYIIPVPELSVFSFWLVVLFAILIIFPSSMFTYKNIESRFYHISVKK